MRSIALKLNLSFLAIASLVLLVGIWDIWLGGKARTYIEEASRHVPRLESEKYLADLFNQQVHSVDRYVFLNESRYKNVYYKKKSESQRIYNQLINEACKDAVAILKRYQILIESYHKLVEGEVFPLFEAGKDRNTIVKKLKQTYPLAMKINANLDNLIAHEKEHIEEAKDSLFSSLETADLMNIIAIVIGTILAIGLGMIVSRSITKPIIALRNGVKKFEKEGLAFKLKPKPRDEVGELAESFENMSEVISKEMEERSNAIGALKETEKKLRQQRDELAIRNRIIGKILETSDLDERINYILNEMVEYFHVEMGGIFLNVEDELILRSSKGLPDRVQEHIRTYPIKDAPIWLKEPNLIHEKAEEEGKIPNFAKKEGFQALASIPLLLEKGSKGKRKLLGTIVLASRSYDALSTNDVAIATKIAEQLSLAVDHARLLSQTKSRLKRLELLREVDRDIMANRSIQEVLKTILRHLPKDFETEIAGISLFEEEKAKTKVFALRLPNGSVIDKEALKVTDCLLSWFNEYKKPLIIHDLLEDGRFLANEDLIRKYRFSSYLGVPLIAQGKVIGILHLITTRPKKFLKEDIEFFRILSGQAAIALKNAQLFSDLRESEEKFYQMSSSAQDAFIVVDNEGKISFWNKAAEQIFGYLEKEALGKEVDKLIIPERYREAYRKGFTKFRQTGTGRAVGKTLELTGIKKDGTEFPIEISLSAAKLKDRWNAIGILRDISERKQLEAQFLQAQKMEAIGRLAGGIAHDFNNILTTIIGNSELILMSGGIEDSLRESIEEIKKAGEKATLLTRQLLAFSRKEKISPQVLDLNDLIANTEKMLRRVIGEDIELVTKLQPELGLVKVDPSQMDQILMNLAVNCRDAMPKGGKLIIETANVDLAPKYFQDHGVKDKPGPYVMLAVSDTGIGMDRETQSKIFDPFFTTKREGTGLGLSTVYGIVKQNGGFIWVYSEPGRGTTIKIYFPRAEEKTEPNPEEEISRDLLHGSETIMVVEDEEKVRNLAVKILRKHGYRVLEAPDGEEALRISDRYKGSIHLLLTDVIMPGMDGRELAGILAHRRPGIKVIYISGYTSNSISHHGVLEQKVNLLQKPFSPETLAKKVRKVLGGR